MPSVALVCMPWHTLSSPSIQVGTLQAVLEEAGIVCRAHSFHVAFQEHLLARAPGGGLLTPREYEDVSGLWGNHGVGDWVFAVEPARARSAERDRRYRKLLRENGATEELLAKLARTRAAVPEFLERCADEVLAGEPDVVGFTTVYSQTWPSAALAHAIVRRAPRVKVVLGGASCEGPMGRAMLEAFPWIDAVARGESETLVVDLVRRLASGGDLGAVPRLCHRRGGEVVETDAAPEPVELDDIPVPSYFEYFERLAHTTHLVRAIEPQIPFETSRGCWWGEKHHCTFCGLNGLDMASRHRSPDSAFELLTELAARHRRHDFVAVDNILPLEYFDSLLPRLAAAAPDLGIFYETKANLTRERVALLRAAGVRAIQPGIESLSSPVLGLMKKGVTGLQNVRLLRWCAEHGMRVIWNLLYGFPGERAEHYAETAALLPSLAHLEPPNLSALALYRFSPYFERPEEHGLRVTRPLAHYRLLHDLPDEGLADLAQVFEHEYADGRAADAFLGDVREGVERWRRDFERNRGALRCRRGPDFLTITDARTTTAGGGDVLRYELDEAEARVYLACDAGAGVGAIERELTQADGAALARVEIEALLDEMVAARLMLREGERYLALALPFGASPTS
jgi:ribosomal peptide maturation radical SAM protein 1